MTERADDRWFGRGRAVDLPVPGTPKWDVMQAEARERRRRLVAMQHIHWAEPRAIDIPPRRSLDEWISRYLRRESPDEQ